MTKKAGWVAILIATVVLLGIGATRHGAAASTAERVQAIAATTKCPVCVGESVGQSNAPASIIIREEIARQVRAGRTDNEVRAAISSQYPDAAQLRPPASGASSLVWILPVFVLVALSAGLVVIFRRGRQ